MISSICTLFEGHYHYGVAGLSNSLYNKGFRGSIYAGYRGTLPDWCSNAQENAQLQWPGSKTLQISKELNIHFLPLETDYHFTNYKPDFMIRLMNGPAKSDEAIYYFDPDIIITAPWRCFEEWVSCGIALCEDVNSPLAENHPRRIAWRNYFQDKGVDLHFKESIYANGGFVGVHKTDIEFLTCWQSIQELMAPEVGGLSRSSLNGLMIPAEARGPFAPFGKTDQDALNATVEAWAGKVSFLGKEAMAFSAGLSLLPHALGHPKPWQWKPLFQALNGAPPRLVDREYWKAVNGPIITHSVGMVKRRRMFINLAAFIGRFYRRGGNSLY